MNLRVTYFTILQELAGTEKDELNLKEGCSLLELIETRSSTYADESFTYLHVADGKRIDPSLKFLINGVDTHRRSDFETELKAGDVVAIIPSLESEKSSLGFPCLQHRLNGIRADTMIFGGT